MLCMQNQSSSQKKKKKKKKSRKGKTGLILWKQVFSNTAEARNILYKNREMITFFCYMHKSYCLLSLLHE